MQRYGIRIVQDLGILSISWGDHMEKKDMEPYVSLRGLIGI